MRSLGALCLLVPLLAAHGAAASGLYESSTIVTGMDARSRPDGLRITLRQVLVKVSGNPGWLNDPRVAQADPAAALQSLLYLDRFTNMPKHDEQGSRDRPFDLVARFDATALDALLLGWGDRPWPLPRPVMAIAIQVMPRTGPPFSLHADTDVDERHRGALLAAAERIGLEIALPAVLDPPPRPPESMQLEGHLVWSDADAGWNSTWAISVEGVTHRWQGRDEGFDAAYRTGLGGAAAALSGHR